VDLSQHIQAEAKGDFSKITSSINYMQADLQEVIVDINSVLEAMSKRRSYPQYPG